MSYFKYQDKFIFYEEYGQGEPTILPASEVLDCVEDFWNKQNIIWSFTTSMRIPLAVLNLFTGRLFLFIN